MFEKYSEIESATKDTPDYELFSKDMGVTVGLTGILFAITVGLMVFTEGTVVSDIITVIFTGIHPLVGVIIISILLTLGRKYGLRGIRTTNHLLALFGVSLTILAYTSLGSYILSLYTYSIYAQAIYISTIITSVIATLGTIFIINFDYDYSKLEYPMSILLFGGFIIYIIGSVLSIYPIIMLGFTCTLLGFVLDLIYEIWHALSGKRTPISNAFAIYIAFTGVFIHILQIVLQMVSR